MPDGFGDFLANPMVQGALAAWLGAAGSPRMAGWGGALSRGGLTGLGAYAQAQQQQQLQPYLQAQTAVEQARLPQMQAQTQLTQAQMRALQREYDSNAHVADWAAQHPEAFQGIPIPHELLVEQLRLGNIKPEQFATMTHQHVQEAIDQQKADAETLRARAEAEVAPLRKRQLTSAANLADARADALNRFTIKPMTEQQMQAEADRQTSMVFGTAPQPGTFEYFTGTAAAARQQRQAYRDQVLGRLRQQQNQARAGLTGGGGADGGDGLPPGWSE